MADFHVRHLLLNELVAADLLAELAALGRVFGGGVENGAGKPQRARGAAQPGGVELRHANLEAFVQFSQQKIFGNLHVFKGDFRRIGGPQADLVVNGFARDAGQGVVHDEAAHAVRARVLVRFDIQQAVVANRAVRDPHFVAVHQVVVALVFGAAFHGGDVRTDIRFGHGEAADIFAGDEFGNVMFFLLFRSKFLDGERRTPALHVEGHAPGDMHPGHLLDGERAFQKAHAVSAVLLVDTEAEKSELCHLVKNFPAPEMVFFVFLDMRRDFLFGKVSRRLLNHFLFFRQCKIHIFSSRTVVKGC